MNHKICDLCPMQDDCTINMIGEVEIIDGEEYRQICEVSYNLILNMFGDNID